MFPPRRLAHPFAAFTAALAVAVALPAPRGAGAANPSDAGITAPEPASPPSTRFT